MKKVWTLLGVVIILGLAVCEKPPQTGSIEVKSEPQGADVALDDSLTGKKTNCVLEAVPFGRHKITLTLEGYNKWERFIDLDEDTPDEEINAGLTDTTEGNYPPEILGVTASPSSVQPNEQSTITCTATDADGDMLTYEWESVDEDTTYTGASFIWTAPETEGDYRFYVTVSDGKGGAAYDSSLVVTVAYGGIQPVTMLPPQDIGTRQATLLWTSAEQAWMGYELYRSEVPDVQTWGQLIVTYSYANGHNRFDTVYTDTDLEPGRTYYYAVQVADSAGNEAWSNEISLTTESFDFLDSEPLGGGHGVRLASKGLFIFAAAREKSVKIFTIVAGGLGAGAEIPHPLGDFSAWAYDLCVTGNLLHVAFGKGGYWSYNITNPFAPVESTFVDALTLGGETRAVYALGSAIFVGCTDPATATNTLVYFDYTNPGILFIDTIFDVPEDIYVTNNYIYVAEGQAGMEILSWNPIAIDPMQHVALFSTYDAAHRVYVSGQYAYIAAGTQGLAVVDVSNPTSPYQASQWIGDEGSDAWGIYTSGNIVYLADGSYGLRVLDLTDPLYPEHIGTKDITSIVGPNDLRDVVIRSEGTWTQAILADWYDAVHMIRW